jgi:hypothetical protein
VPTTLRPAASVELGARVAFREPRIDRADPSERIREPLLAGLLWPPDHWRPLTVTTTEPGGPGYVVSPGSGSSQSPGPPTKWSETAPLPLPKWTTPSRVVISGERAGGGGVNMLAWHHDCASGVLCATCSLTAPVRVSEPRGGVVPLGDAGPPQAAIARAASGRSLIGNDTLMRIPRLSATSSPGFLAQARVRQCRWTGSRRRSQRTYVGQVRSGAHNDWKRDPEVKAQQHLVSCSCRNCPRSFVVLVLDPITRRSP